MVGGSIYGSIWSIADIGSQKRSRAIEECWVCLVMSDSWKLGSISLPRNHSLDGGCLGGSICEYMEYCRKRVRKKIKGYWGMRGSVVGHHLISGSLPLDRRMEGARKRRSQRLEGCMGCYWKKVKKDQGLLRNAWVCRGNGSGCRPLHA